MPDLINSIMKPRLTNHYLAYQSADIQGVSDERFSLNIPWYETSLDTHLLNGFHRSGPALTQTILQRVESEPDFLLIDGTQGVFDPILTISPYACVDRHIINVRGILDVSEKVYAIGCVDEPEELGDRNEREPKFISGGLGAL